MEQENWENYQSRFAENDVPLEPIEIGSQATIGSKTPEAAAPKEPRFKPVTGNKPVSNEKKPAGKDGGAELKQAHSELDKIAAAINKHKATIEREEYKIGEWLNKAKAITVKHGGWSKFLQKVSLTDRTAQRYMLLAREYPNATTVVAFGMSKSLELLNLPAAKREAFIKSTHIVPNSKGENQQKTVEDMSVRDLKEAIAQKTGTDTSKDKAEAKVKRIVVPMNLYYPLFKNQPPNEVIDEIIEAVKFYRQHKGKA